MPLQPGEILDGKYRIVRLLGEGGMGAVYEGENTRIKRRIAIKVLHAAVAEKADVVQRFEREAQAAGRIGSDHIVEVLDLGNLPSGERYMVMEYLDGEDLTSRIKRFKRLTAEACVPLLHQLLEGLTAAHEAQIIHRDLKPDNVYILAKHVGRADFVKILDFGVSKFSALDAEMSMTRTGAVMGTPYYMSPEQAKGGKLDHRTDLYAVGVILYQMVTGRVPFNAGSFNELLFKIALESPEPIESIVPGIDPTFVSIVTRAMQRDADARFQTARDFQLALAEWAARRQGAALAGAPATAALPQMPDMRASQQSHPDLGGGMLAPIGGHHLPTPPGGMYPSSPGLANPGLANPGLANPGLANPGLGSGSYPGIIPGTNTPAGPLGSPLGMSQPAMAMTPTPIPRRSGMVVALAAVTVGIVAAGGVGAYMLTRPASADTAGASGTAAPDGTVTATAGPDATGPDTAGTADTPTSEPAASAGAADPAGSAEPADTATPDATAAPGATAGPDSTAGPSAAKTATANTGAKAAGPAPGVKGRPVPPTPQPTAKPSAKPKTGGRKIETNL